MSSMFDVLSQHTPQKHYPNRRVFSSIDELRERLRAAEGKPIREIDGTGRTVKKKNKGGQGEALEESVAQYRINSDPNPDLLVGGIPYELKMTPLRHYSKKSKKPRDFDLYAKERLVIDIINYLKLPDEHFDTSTFWRKAKNMVIIYYIDDRKDRQLEPRNQCKIYKSVILDYRDQELATIREDWQFIHDKVAAGYADLLSESDTNYLAASTKGSTAATSIRRAPAPEGSAERYIKAKQRAFSYKASYMSMVAKRLLGTSDGERLQLSADESLSQFVRSHANQYVGHTCREIVSNLAEYHLPSVKANQYKQRMVLAMLGVKSKNVDAVEQFKAAGVTQVKVVERFNDELPKESMSFPYITEDQWNELGDPTATWHDSFMYRFFEDNRMLICSLRNRGTRTHKRDFMDDTFEGAFLWNMPEEDIERYIRPVWERVHQLMVDKVPLHYGERRGSNLLPDSSFNGVCHIRPHGGDGTDRILLPNGESITKQAFWLDRRYVAKIIHEHLG